MRGVVHGGALARYGGQALVALACAAAVAGLSRFTWEAAADDRARLRLSWQSTSPRVEACRTPTEEELAELPPHMRMREICEGRLLPFRLRLWIDGELRIDERIRPQGARGDRPLSILHEIAVRPGVHELRVAFEPEDGDRSSEAVEGRGAEGVSEAPEGEAPAPGLRRAAVSEPLALAATVELAPREVALVTREADAGGLVLRDCVPAK